MVRMGNPGFPGTHRPFLACEDCGDGGVTWEDGVVLCVDCAILRAKKLQMERERTDG